MLEVAIYLFYSRGEDEAAVASWLAPLHVVSAAIHPPYCGMQAGTFHAR